MKKLIHTRHLLINLPQYNIRTHTRPYTHTHSHADRHTHFIFKIKRSNYCNYLLESINCFLNCCSDYFLYALHMNTVILVSLYLPLSSFLEFLSLFFGSTAVHGKILLVSNISKNLWIWKAASCQTAERTDHTSTPF